MKKEWLKPEVKSLNLGNTNEEGVPCPEDAVSATSTGRMIICAYPGCFHYSGFNKYCTCHKSAAEGEGPNPDDMPGLDPTPLS